MKNVNYFDSMVYLTKKAEKTDLDVFDKEIVVRIAELMKKNAMKVVERYGYKARAACEVKYLADAVLSSARLDIYNHNSLRRLYDWWLTLENETRYGVEA